MSGGEDRTLDPSARRLDQARRDGNVAVSRELGLLGTLGMAAAASLICLPSGVGRLESEMAGLLANAGRIEIAHGGVSPVLRGLAGSLAVGFLPIMVAAMLGALGIGLLQTGLLVRLAALMPDIGRVSPLSGCRRIFGGETAIEALKAVVKLGVFAAVLWSCVRSVASAVGGLAQLGPASMLGVFGHVLRHALWGLVAVQVLIAVADVGWVRSRRFAKLRMTQQEQREEFKESEGDPHIKGRLRALRNRRARRRMLDAVPAAAVVITNPTHYAVALAYDQGGHAAPRVVAKGVDEVAARIRAAARQHNVPMVPNPPLARALHRLELDTEIPREHFQAVAAIIAFVWRQNRAARPPLPPVT